jgi:hypothetical protein
MKKRVFAIVVSMLSSVAAADYVTFRGQTNNTNAPVGSLSIATNWTGAIHPSGSSTGLVSSTVNVWSGTAWNSLAVRQTGGYVAANGGLALRGGLTNSGITTKYIIEDARTDYASYTNLYSYGANSLAFFSQFGEKMELSLLSGHIEAQTLSLNAAGKGTLNMRNGLLHAGNMINGKATVNMLAGGTGDIIIDSLDVSLNNTLYLNFETGNQGSFTFNQKTNGVSAAGTWAYLVGNGQVSIDGVATTDLSKFSITGAGLSNTIELIPEPATIGMLGLGALLTIVLRRIGKR